MDHVKSVQQIYAAFGRGDIAAIINQLDEDVVWDYGFAKNDIPWLQPRRGKASIPGFFENLSMLEFHNFAPKHILGDQGLVVALVDIEATVKTTGNRIVEEDEVHLWHFNAEGMVAKFRHVADTLQHWQALQPAAVSA